MDKHVFTERPDRRAVDMWGFALADGLDADIAVMNMSYEGCQVRSSQELERDQIVELRIVGRGRVRAEVRWTQGLFAGLSFFRKH